MKFTAYQHKKIAERYLARINAAMSDKHNDEMAHKAQKHVEAHIKMTGQLPE